MTEHAGLEHKARLDLAKNADKLGLVAEVVAMANAEGGVIRVGVTDDGTESGVSPDLARRFDPARVASQHDCLQARLRLDRRAGGSEPW